MQDDNNIILIAFMERYPRPRDGYSTRARANQSRTCDAVIGYAAFSMTLNPTLDYLLGLNTPFDASLTIQS